MRKLFTSESVTEGHPDKLCDQISDAVLDAILSEDPEARVACETVATTGMVFVMGEISTSTYVSIPDIARQVVIDVGYNSSDMGFDGNSCAVMTAVNEQSSDIAGGVSHAQETRDQQEEPQQLGAGDQGMMFGYACDETEELMPMPISLAHQLTRRMAEVRKLGLCPWMRPDGKAQVSVAYEGDRPVAVDTVVISTQHDQHISQQEIAKAMIDLVILPVIPGKLLHEGTRFLVNPSGRFVIGGPAGDSGLTGRKIIVDTYGGYAPHGGGCFSGKDPTKVDRSASYLARYLAKNVVAAGLARRCQVALAYAIGVARPVSFTVDCFGTAQADEARIADTLAALVDLRPSGIISRFQLRRPIYRQVSNYGHFGRQDLDLPWEATNLVDHLRAQLMH